jgi:hypothetical protein
MGKMMIDGERVGSTWSIVFRDLLGRSDLSRVHLLHNASSSESPLQVCHASFNDLYRTARRDAL